MPRSRNTTETMSKHQKRHTRPKFKTFQCHLCPRKHALRFCKKFLNMNTEDRMRTVILNKNCFNCLAHKHSGTSCRSETSCRYCNEKHHTLLHTHERLRRNHSEVQMPKKEAPPTLTSILSQHTVNLLPTAIIKIEVQGTLHYARALLDPCATVSRISSALVKHHSIPTTSIGADKVCSVSIRSRFDLTVNFGAILRMDNKISMQTPSRSLNEKIKDKFSNLILGDTKFYQKAPISIVLGADLYPKVLKSGVLPSNGGLPIAQDTVFGWILSGPCVI